jgi:hypothetical protein
LTIILYALKPHSPEEQPPAARARDRSRAPPEPSLARARRPQRTLGRLHLRHIHEPSHGGILVRLAEHLAVVVLVLDVNVLLLLFVLAVLEPVVLVVAHRA